MRVLIPGWVTIKKNRSTKVLLFFFMRLFWAAENSDTKNRLRFLCKGS